MELYVLTPGQSEATRVCAEDDWTVGRLKQHFIDGQGRQGVECANPTKVQLFRVDGLLPNSHEVQALETGDTSVLGGLTMYEMSSPEILRTHFPVNPPSGHIHVLVVLPTRRINCLIPCRRDHGQTLPGFIVTVDADVNADVVQLKEIIAKTVVGLIEDARSYYLHLFPALRDGCWLQASSSEAGDLERGDLSVLDEIVQQNQEMTALEKVSKYFPFNPADTFIHVIVMPLMRRITCVVPGIRESKFDIWIDEYVDISTLKEACRQKTYLQGIPEFRLIKAQSGNSWLRSDGDDARAPAIGEATERVQILMKTGEARGQDFITTTFETAPYENTIHVLAIVPGLIVRRSLPSILGKRPQGHWDVLNGGLKRQKTASNCSKPVALRDIVWNNVSSAYILQHGIPGLRISPVAEPSMNTIYKSVLEALQVLPRDKNEREISWALFSLFPNIISTELKQFKIHGEHLLASHEGRVDAHGKADFIIRNGDNFVSLVEVKKPQTSHAGGPFKQPGIPQVVVGMELLNTQSNGVLANGILTDYCSWTFMRIMYPDDHDGSPTILYDTDNLVASARDTPRKQNLERIVGKIVSVLSTSLLPPSSQTKFANVAKIDFFDSRISIKSCYPDKSRRCKSY